MGICHLNLLHVCMQSNIIYRVDILEGENMFQTGDLCVIHSKTSTNNGKVVEVIQYTKGRYSDILQVKIRNHKFLIKETSLKLASKYDLIRNLSDKQLKKMLHKRKEEEA